MTTPILRPPCLVTAPDGCAPRLVSRRVLSAGSPARPGAPPRPNVSMSRPRTTRVSRGLDARPREGSAGLDRRLFDLGAMSPGYFKILGRAPAYLDVPHTALPLAEFPANSSAQTRAELDFLLELQAKSRTPENVARSQALAGVFYRVSTQPGDEDFPRMRRNLFFMGSELGDWFGPDALPKTADLMARVQADATYYIWAHKYRFDRARPYELEPRIAKLETPNFPAYPSAHSANSWVAAFVFQELLPEHRDAFSRGPPPRWPFPARSSASTSRAIRNRAASSRARSWTGCSGSPEFRQGSRGGARRNRRREAGRGRQRRPAAATTGTRKDECF